MEGKKMDTEIIVAVLALIGTAVGSLAGIITANKLTNYRISELEKKVDKHNNVIERITVVERDLKSAYHLIDNIKEALGGYI
jgi:branched-subunit amino acid permease